jgi:hypothetical protein
MNQLDLQVALYLPSEKILPTTPFRDGSLINFLRAIGQSSDEFELFGDFTLRNDQLSQGKS